jgi:hypothetical protein
LGNYSAKYGNGIDHHREGKKGEDESDGKPGQDGGNEARGLNGTDEKDADKEAMIKKLEYAWALWGGAAPYRSRCIGTDGQSGGWEGDADSGRFRGDGGNLRLIKLFALYDTSQSISYENSPGEAGSDDGKPGKSGETGKYGKDGLDYLAAGEWEWFKRKIDIKGVHLHSNDRWDEENFRFRSKYYDINVQRGASATHKH